MWWNYDSPVRSETTLHSVVPVGSIFLIDRMIIAIAIAIAITIAVVVDVFIVRTV